jgi:hypothetical protein
MVKKIILVGLICISAGVFLGTTFRAFWEYETETNILDTDRLAVGSQARDTMVNILWPDFLDELETDGGFHTGIIDEQYIDDDIARDSEVGSSNIWECGAGTCDELAGTTGDSFDASAIDSSIPWVTSTDCSGVTTNGHACYDSDDHNVYVGNGSSAELVGPGDYETLSSDGIVVNSSGTPLARTIAGGGIATISNGDGVSGNPQVTVTAATASTINSGTSATTAVTPDALAGSNLGSFIKHIRIIATDASLSTGDDQFSYFIPIELNGMNLVNAQAAVFTASSSGTPTFQIYNVTDTTDMLSTAITIDATENTSYTATTPSVVDSANDDVATGDQIRIDCDVAGTDTTGWDMYLTFRLP